ncbi:hypothetical protein GCM10025880_61440 [Methylorubrum aminovorans]|nr:hypothetical protein GCM10025880_61440 [Methylorubrum aminovorans]
MLLEDQAVARHAERVGVAADDLGLGDGVLAGAAGTAGEDEARLRVAPGEITQRDGALAGFVDGDLVTADRGIGLDRPPRTMMPVTGVPSSAKAGKRFSSGASVQAESGESPATKSPTKPAIARTRPIPRPNSVKSSRQPTSPSKIRKFDGVRTKKISFESGKNIVFFRPEFGTASVTG